MIGDEEEEEEEKEEGVVDRLEEVDKSEPCRGLGVAFQTIEDPVVESEDCDQVLGLDASVNDREAKVKAVNKGISCMLEIVSMVNGVFSVCFCLMDT